MRSKGFIGNDGDIAIMGPDALDEYVATLELCSTPSEPVDPARNVAEGGYLTFRGHPAQIPSVTRSPATTRRTATR